jgi:hypothetical protein
MSTKKSPQDAMEEMAIKLDFETIATYCKIYKRFNKFISKNEKFWQLKVLMDFGRVAHSEATYKKTYKKHYSFKFLSEAQELIKKHNPDIYMLQRLASLEVIYHLQTLHLGWRKIIDLSPLRHLAHLKILILRDNEIEDVSPLASLKKLEDVDLSTNKIEDVSPLQNLKHLKTLDIRDNVVNDVAPFLKFASLETLKIGEQLRNRHLLVELGKKVKIL